MNAVNACVVMTTTSTEADAERIARTILQERLAACVQIQPIRSYYWWDGKINNDAEQLLLFKTTAETYPALQAAIAATHPYETPEIVQVPIVNGADKYLAWIQRETSPA